MHGNLKALVIFLTIILLVDIYSFQAIKLLVYEWDGLRKKIFYGIYWLITGVSVLIVLSSFVFGSPANMPNWFRVGVMAPVFIILLSKVVLIVFLLLDDSRRLITWGLDKFSSTKEFDVSRSQFITNIGLVIAGSLLGSLIYGIMKGAYNYTIHRKKIAFNNLPDSFEGLKIVQISDLHVGSFVSERPLEKAIKIIQDINPDLILFTGDLVNNIATELTPFESTLKKLTAPLGVYSILGNHDYGDYVRWDSDQEKMENFNLLLKKQTSFGWKLLLDESVEIFKNGESINLVGIQNWGAKARFPKYGNLEKACRGINKSKPTILMSHDPSHWNAQVTSNDFNFIDLTLSGHTHGMQFGVEIPNWIKWSPVKYIYKQWAGLYEQNGQKLYVNRGLGFIGYPGRVGISPEITLLELQKV